MCWFLYGSVNEGVNQDDLDEIESERFCFRPHAQTGLKKKINADDGEYRIRNAYCDCDTAVGKQDYDAPELKELAEYIGDLRYVQNIEWVYICKKLQGRQLKGQQINVCIDDIDLVPFLADMRIQCLYQIQLCRSP